MDYVYFECTHIAEADFNDPDEMHAFAYADIDGYPSDEDGQGTVICRVYLLRGKENETEPAYLTDWHHNGYRMNDSVLECIEHAKKNLLQWFHVDAAYHDVNDEMAEGLKIFGVSTDKEYKGYGIDCGIVIAESKQEARRIVRENTECYMADDEDIFEIPFEKGFTFIGSYSE